MATETLVVSHQIMLISINILDSNANSIPFWKCYKWGAEAGFFCLLLSLGLWRPESSLRILLQLRKWRPERSPPLRTVGHVEVHSVERKGRLQKVPLQTRQRKKTILPSLPQRTAERKRSTRKSVSLSPTSPPSSFQVNAETLCSYTNNPGTYSVHTETEEGTGGTRISAVCLPALAQAAGTCGKRRLLMTSCCPPGSWQLGL